MATKRKPTRKPSVRKAAAQRQVRKSPAKRPGRGRKRSTMLYLKPIFGLAILALIVWGGVLLADYLLEPSRPAPAPPAVSVRPSPSPPPKVAAVEPKYEIFPPPEVEPLSRPPIETPVPPPVQARPRIAIIIDDLGYDRKMAAKFISLDGALTFAVLPHSPFQKKIAELAYAEGKETMLHLPMEPSEYPAVDPGPGTLLSTMPPDELIRQLEENLDAVPHVKGVNNHMGSRLTTASDQVHQIFTILKKRGLFFVDSRTTSATVCRPSAELLQVPFAQRDVFIDHFQEAAFIRKQLKELVRIARRNGHAVGIAHPHRITYRILKEMLPEIRNEVQLVPASEIVQTIG